MIWNPFKKQTEKKGAAPREKIETPREQVKAIAPAAAPRRTFRFSAHADKIFIRPLATEKSLEQARHDVYVFEVAPDTTKIDVKKAFANMYGVMPKNVRIMRQRGKVVRFARREGKRKDWKKALVTVAKGTTIEIQ